MTSISVALVADAIRQQAVQAGQDTPAVRGADWRTALVATVGSDGTVTTTDGIVARRLDSYLNPTVSDKIVIVVSGNGNWMAAGRVATAADGAWTSYTPTWTAGTTNPSLGNGTLIGRYQKLGRTVHLHINLTTGSTTTYGSGGYSFALPFAAANLGCSYIGNAHLFQSSPAGRYGGQFIISPGASTAAPSFPDSSLSPVTRHTLWNPTVPLTFSNGGQMRITVTYESAT